MFDVERWLLDVPLRFRGSRRELLRAILSAAISLNRQRPTKQGPRGRAALKAPALQTLARFWTALAESRSVWSASDLSALSPRRLLKLKTTCPGRQLCYSKAPIEDDACRHTGSNVVYAPNVFCTRHAGTPSIRKLRKFADTPHLFFGHPAHESAPKNKRGPPSPNADTPFRHPGHSRSVWSASGLPALSVHGHNVWQ